MQRTKSPACAEIKEKVLYKYLHSLEKFGMHLGLERIKYLLEKLDNPHLKFKSIHIAGTNGKGSTAAMIASILKQGGYKVGLYTSPHLFDYTERVKINNKNISSKEFKQGLRLLEKAAKGMAEKPTVFEVLTAVAFWYFGQKEVDYAVVEVGLGGRLDATNVIRPQVTIITNIDYEHTDILGKSLESITREKAGTIKPGIPVITADTKPEVLKVLKEVCEKNGSILVGIENDQSELRTNLLGKHQRVNAACALSAIRLAGIEISERDIKAGLKKVVWPARMQLLSHKPLIIVDGAHNPAGAKTLRVTIQEEFKDKFTLIFGCQEKKDFQGFIKEIEPVVSNIIITRSSNKLAADPTYLSNHFLRLKVPVSKTYSIQEALSKWDKKSPLLISGSLFLVADCMPLLA